MQLIHAVLRFSQFLWTLLITALIGNVIADAFGGNPGAINYAMFVAVFCWLVLIYGFAASIMESLLIPIALLVLDALAVIFTFIAGVVLAAKLHVHSCGNMSYVTTNSLTAGSDNPSKRCHELQASTAFFWFLFASFVGSLVLVGLASRGSTSVGGGMRRGGPSMSQV